MGDQRWRGDFGVATRFQFRFPDEAAVHEAWVASFATALHQSDGVYVNFLGDEGKARVHEVYPESIWRTCSR